MHGASGKLEFQQIRAEWSEFFSFCDRCRASLRIKPSRRYFCALLRSVVPIRAGPHPAVAPGNPPQGLAHCRFGLHSSPCSTWHLLCLDPERWCSSLWSRKHNTSQHSICRLRVAGLLGSWAEQIQPARGASRGAHNSSFRAFAIWSTTALFCCHSSC